MNARLPLSMTSAAVHEDEPISPIVQPYLLVIFSLPFYVDSTGRRWINPLWAKDLVEHVRYIKQLTLAASMVRAAAPENSVAMDEVSALRDLRCVELPAPRTLLAALACLPRTVSILWREVGRARIVHCGVAAWPLAEAWLLVPMLWARRRILYINVESSFWRLVPGEANRLRRRVRAALIEKLNRFCVESSDICTFTHEGYRRSLLRRGRDRGHVVEASWIDAGNLLTDDQLESMVSRRRQNTAALRLVFAGRLAQAKGLLVLLDAATACARTGIEFELDIFGEGPLEAECASLIRERDLTRRVRMRGSLPYDQRFFEALREYDALVVPAISDEQPRIVFDAYSQGLPVIASRTDGLVQCVEDGVTGLLFEVGSVQALQDRLASVAGNREMLANMSRVCLARARGLTHQRMHQLRWRLLARAFPELTSP